MPADLLTRWLCPPRDLPQRVTTGVTRWTDEQQRAIDRRGGDMLLDAAAGSGKTSVLVERFVESVLTDGIDVSAILAITFTDKAAGELRDRIRARLAARGALDQARRAQDAFISTIHGFCARALRSGALAAGLEPRFEVLDSDRTRPMAAAAFEDSLVALHVEQPGSVELVAAYGAPALRDATLSVHGRLRSAGATRPRLPDVTEVSGARLAQAAGELAQAAAAVVAELETVASPGPMVIQAIERARACERLASQTGPDAPWPPELGRLVLPRNGSALSTDACAGYGTALDAFRELCAVRAAAPVRDWLDRLLQLFGERYDARKRAAGGLDFSDLELLAAELLRDDERERERWSRRFELIMVDELQDTNRVQLGLIESIARDNLFTVGDARQSIYGFRHADVELFIGRGERLAAAGARLRLTSNFRSRPQIVAALNHAFGSLGDGFDSLVAARSGEDGDEPSVELVLVDKGADWEQEGVASPWRLAEARTMAARVAELVGEGWSPGEIVVLLRATTDMRAYERALEAHGLPTYVIGGRGYWSHPQVVDLVAYLRALRNPRDEEALYGVLASPLVGASLDALVLVAAASRETARDPWWILREPRGELDDLGDEDRVRLAAFAAWFAAERRTLASRSLDELIDAALERSGYDLTMLAAPGGRRRLANVRKLMRIAREHEALHGPDLPGFLDTLIQRVAGAAGSARESEAPVESEGLDAIRLMTIHRAKGLEFPVVVVADLGRCVRASADLVRVSGDGRLGIRLARAGFTGREPALEYRELAREEREAAEREERRLFYVAMTRARERLLLSGAIRFEGVLGSGATGGGPVAWIAPALVPELGSVIQEGGGVVARDGVRVAVRVGWPGETGDARPPAVGGSAEPAREDAPVPAAPTLRAATAPRRPPVAALSYSALADYQRCGYRFYAERVLRLPPSRRDRPAGSEGGLRSASDRGLLLHALLERLDFRRPLIPALDAVREAAARAGLKPAPGPAEADELVSVLRGFASSRLCERLGRVSEAAREQRFAFAGAGGMLITGAFDVLAREPGEVALVVDFKSDRLEGRPPEAAVQADYQVQRHVYALAALRAGYAAVEVVHCFLERPDEPVVARFERAVIGELENRLEALAGGVLAWTFPVSSTPERSLCADCPAAGGLCSWPTEMTARESPDTLF